MTDPDPRVLYIRIDSIADGATVFRSAESLALHIVGVLGRMRKKRPETAGLESLFDLRRVCALALGSCTDARHRLAHATEGPRCKARLQFFDGGVATWIG